VVLVKKQKEGEKLAAHGLGWLPHSEKMRERSLEKNG